MAERTIVVDFDGTITQEDILDAIAQTFGDMDVYREVDEALDRNGITLHEVLRREFEPVTAPLEEVVEWVLEHSTVRPGFRELVELAHERGWRLVVVSSGFRQLIEPVLEREGVGELELVSNEVEPDPGGWRISFFDESRVRDVRRGLQAADRSRHSYRKARSSTSATATPTAAPPRTPTTCSPGAGSRRTCVIGASPFTHFDDFDDVIAGLA